MAINCKELLSVENGASLKEAYVQCAATIDAAWIEGASTFGAGVLALGAGILAYKAATRQNRLQEDKEQALRETYKNRTIFVLRYLRQQILDILIWADYAVKKEEAVNLPFHHLHLPTEIDSSNWQNNALLPLDVVKVVQRLSEKASHYDSFLREAMDLSLSSKDYSRMYVSFKSKTPMPDGGIQFVMHNVAEQALSQGEEMNELIIEALETLGFDLREDNEEYKRRSNKRDTMTNCADSKTDTSSCQNNSDCQKKIAFHSTCMDAWVQTRMEKDRQLLGLSALAIGLLMIFHDKLDTLPTFLLWLGAGGLFLACILVVLRIFAQNADYLICAAADDAASRAKADILGRSLGIKTNLAAVLFVLGVVATLSLAVMKTGFTITKIGIQKEETRNVGH